MGLVITDMQPDAANAIPTKIQNRLTRHSQHEPDRVFPRAETVFGREPARHPSNPALECNLWWRSEDCMAEVWRVAPSTCRKPEVPGTRAAAVATAPKSHRLPTQRVPSQNGNGRQHGNNQPDRVEAHRHRKLGRLRMRLAGPPDEIRGPGTSSPHQEPAPNSGPGWALSLRQWFSSG